MTVDTPARFIDSVLERTRPIHLPDSVRLPDATRLSDAVGDGIEQMNQAIQAALPDRPDKRQSRAPRILLVLIVIGSLVGFAAWRIRRVADEAAARRTDRETTAREAFDRISGADASQTSSGAVPVMAGARSSDVHGNGQRTDLEYDGSDPFATATTPGV